MHSNYVMVGCVWALLSLSTIAHAAERTMPEQCDDLAAAWKDRLLAERFEVVVAPPFVIAGNGGQATLTAFRDRTILAAKDALDAMYFKTPVDRPILIFLFADAPSYKKLARKWFNDTDLPHYGFYRHHNRTMLMNIATGGGTLVHELTHALIAADFPGVPDWFNEGFASLYEQCSINGKTITGHPNWRLAGLQKAIRDKKLRPIADMIQDDDFRNDERVGINYAQARYLMLYLQERKQLQLYYTSFRDARKEDPTGLETLKALIGPEKWKDFDREWQDWVLTLRF